MAAAYQVLKPSSYKVDPHYHGNLKQLSQVGHCCRYHIYCVGLRRVPSGRWHCKECAVCGSCGTQEPGGNNPDTPNAQWQHEVRIHCASIGLWSTFYVYTNVLVCVCVRVHARMHVCVYILACMCTHACSNPSPLFSNALHSTTICEGMCLPPVCTPCNMYLSVQHILADLAVFTCQPITEILCDDCGVISPILAFLQGIETSHIL